MATPRSGEMLWKTIARSVSPRALSSNNEVRHNFDISEIHICNIADHGRGIRMAEYEEILRFLASNPPHLAPEKKFHASLLETLAKKLREEAIEEKAGALNAAQGALALRVRLH
jgi:hypothetical protein